MADPIRKQIRDRFKVVLNADVTPPGLVPGAAKPAGLSVHGFRTRPLEKDELPASVVYSGDEEQSQSTHDLDVMCEYRVVVEHRVKGDVEDALEPLLAWGAQAVLADRRLNGLAINVMCERVEWAAEERDAIYGAAAQIFKVQYRTNLADPETKS